MIRASRGLENQEEEWERNLTEVLTTVSHPSSIDPEIPVLKVRTVHLCLEERTEDRGQKTEDFTLESAGLATSTLGSPV